jgi:tetratricopeptide (TPR) repeat protein
LPSLTPDPWPLTPKISDFGLAKDLSGLGPDKASTVIAGTPSYMAPEQAQGRSATLGPAADVYSLGTILYELLTGRPPFRGESTFETLLQVVGQEPVPVRQLQPRVPRDLETVCLKCLAKEPRRRYPTAAALAEDLRRFLDGRPVQARPVGAAGRAWRWCRRNPGTAAALAGAVAALLAGTVVSLLFALAAWQNAAAETVARLEADRSAEEARVNAAQALAEKARADGEAALARGVNLFLRRDLLLQADPQIQATPNQSPDRDVKLRTILDQAAGRIAGQFPDRPLVEAAIRNSIGVAYCGLGEYDLALPHLQAAFDTQSRFLGADHLDALDSLNTLGVVYHRQGHYRRAEEVGLRFLEGCRRTRGPGHRETLLAMSNLAAVYLDQGRYAEAEPLLQSALEEWRRKPGANDRFTLSLQQNLARLWLARGEFARSEKLLLQTWRAYQQIGGDDHPLTLDCQHNLAMLYQADGRLAEPRP